MAFPRFGIVTLINDIGDTVTVVGRTGVTYNNRGDISGATYTYTNVQAIAQQLTAEDEEVKEGIMQPGDLEVFIDDQTSISGTLVIGNQISGSFFGSTSRTYDIKEVLQEKGHYKVLASKL